MIKYLIQFLAWYHAFENAQNYVLYIQTYVKLIQQMKKNSLYFKVQWMNPDEKTNDTNTVENKIF